MKDEVENMEAEMSKLVTNMNNIADNCSKIEGRFNHNRSELEKLVSVRGLLKKLEFLFQLPNRLRKNIELGAYDRAVKYFKMATSILSSYKHIQSFNRISIESQEIINDLQENLKKQMIQKNITATKQLEIAKLLLSLNQQPELLWYDIFKTRKDALMTTIYLLKTSEKVINYYNSQKNEDIKEETKQSDLDDTNPFNQDKLDDTNPFAIDTAPDLVEQDEDNEDDKDSKVTTNAFFSIVDHFKIGFLSLFIDFVEHYNAVFILPFQKNHLSEKQSASSTLSRSSSRSSRSKSVGSMKSRDNQQSTFEKSMAALTSFTREIFGEYFNVIKQCLQRENNIDKLTEELQAFYDGLYKPSKLVPNARLQDKGTEIIESCIRTSMEREFITTRKQQLLFLISYMKNNYDINKIEMNSDEYNYTNNEYHIKKCVNHIKITGIDCLNHLVPLTTNQSQLINILDLNFDDQLWSYTANLFKIFNEIIPIELRVNTDGAGYGVIGGGDNNMMNNTIMMMNDDNDDTDCNEEETQFIDNIYHDLYNTLSPIKLLILSKILIGIANNVIGEVIKHFKKNFLYDRENKNTASLGIYKQEVLLFKRYCQECSNGLRLMYSQRIAKHIVDLIDELESFEINSNKDKRTLLVQQIQSKINVSINNMKKIYNIRQELISCHIVQNQGLNNNQSSLLPSNTKGNLRDYEKLFNEGCLIYDKVNDKADSVLFTIYKIIFKHWSEILRLKIIPNVHIFNLIQGDIKYFRNNIPKILSKKDLNKLQTLLDEIQQSAKERCRITTDRNRQADDNNDDTVDID